MLKRGSSTSSFSGGAPGGATCDQLPFVSRLAVDNPSSLMQEPWLGHMRECAVCRQEAAEHSRALAIFSSIESERLASESSALTWESVQAAIQREEAEIHSHARSRAWWGIPMAAAAAGMLATAAVLGWDSAMDDGQPAPARIVRVEPPQQQSMDQVLRWTLGTEGPRSDFAWTGRGADVHFDAPDLERPPLGTPEARELAATVSPLVQENVSMERESLPLLPARGPAPSAAERQRRNPSAAGRGSNLPLLRLEHRLILTQPVSLSAHE
jgi:hypothetical protein